MNSENSHKVLSKNMKFDNFLKKNLDSNREQLVYGYDVCLKDNQNLKIFVPFIINKFEYRIIIVCRECLLISDNPPERLERRINLSDIIEIKTVRL